MKKILLFTATFCLLMISAIAQKDGSTDFDVTLGPPYKVVDAGTKLYFHEGDEIMTIKIRGGDITIQKMGLADLNQQSVKEYEMPKGFQYESVQKFNSKYYLFFSDGRNCRGVTASNGQSSHLS